MRVVRYLTTESLGAAIVRAFIDRLRYPELRIDRFDILALGLAYGGWLEAGPRAWPTIIIGLSLVLAPAVSLGAQALWRRVRTPRPLIYDQEREL